MVCNQIEKLIDYSFRDPQLLERALTHSSYANDYLGSAALSNERLEFLGDAILDAVVGYELYRRFPERNEGYLTRIRAEIVCEKSLGNAAIKLGLNNFIRLGKGEETLGGRNRLSIVADSVEAIIAAVFLDGGVEAAAGVVRVILDETIVLAESGRLNRDTKTELQIICQKNARPGPVYRIADEQGPDHAKVFTVEVSLEDMVLGTGTGRTKKDAQMQAAASALKYLEDTAFFKKEDNSVL